MILDDFTKCRLLANFHNFQSIPTFYEEDDGDDDCGGD